MLIDSLPSLVAATTTGAEYDQLVREAYEARYPIQDGIVWHGDAYASDTDVDGADRANHGLMCFHSGVKAYWIGFTFPASPYEIGTPEDAERTKTVLEVARALTAAGVMVLNGVSSYDGVEVTRNDFKEKA